MWVVSEVVTTPKLVQRADRHHKENSALPRTAFRSPLADPGLPFGCVPPSRLTVNVSVV